MYNWELLSLPLTDFLSPDALAVAFPLGAVFFVGLLFLFFGAALGVASVVVVVVVSDMVSLLLSDGFGTAQRVATCSKYNRSPAGVN